MNDANGLLPGEHIIVTFARAQSDRDDATPPAVTAILVAIIDRLTGTADWREHE